MSTDFGYHRRQNWGTLNRCYHNHDRWAMMFALRASKLWAERWVLVCALPLSSALWCVELPYAVQRSLGLPCAGTQCVVQVLGLLCAGLQYGAHGLMALALVALELRAWVLVVPGLVALEWVALELVALELVALV